MRALPTLVHRKAAPPPFVVFRDGVILPQMERNQPCGGKGHMVRSGDFRPFRYLLFSSRSR